MFNAPKGVNVEHARRSIEAQATFLPLWYKAEDTSLRPRIDRLSLADATSRY